jgi:hypothetical protein
MTEWWEKPYPGGKMVPVPGFPRPVYPPDAAKQGKTPSSPGPDIDAYKRVVSRAGRWPWQKFDENFSNAFSHGKGTGNVGDSGVAGIQRQQKIDDTGWIGPATFKTFRSIKIPAGLPHAGQMAMDVTAQNLIAEAWTLFGGKETVPPEPGKTVRQLALEGAIRHIGTKESPRGSNHTAYGEWYGVDYQPWCAIFVTYCFVIEAGGSPSFERGSQYAYVPYVVRDAHNNRNGLSVTKDPIPGDAVCFDWQRDVTFDHIGIFEKWIDKSAGIFQSVEGNTGANDFSNGGQVMRAQRNVRGYDTVFVRVQEP